MRPVPAEAVSPLRDAQWTSQLVRPPVPRLRRRVLTHHPDSGVAVVGAQVPYWDPVLDAASACGPATGLRYVGADVVVDRDAGPLVLEVNARPGLQIQNVTGVGLRDVAPSLAA